MNYKQRISEIIKATHRWLSDENGSLSATIDQSVHDEMFDRSDIFHRLQEVERTVTHENLEKWCQEVGISNTDNGQLTNDSAVLCLHAGNLPLVGLQDIIAVLLSGKTYIGKVSRNDMILTSSFLDELKKSNLENRMIWQTRLDDIKGEWCKAVMFSGSEETLPKVWQKLHEIGCECPPENRLIRTASYSAVWMERCSNKDLHHLAEAILRYRGNGCRSVKLVVSPVDLDSVATPLKEIIDHHLYAIDSQPTPTVNRELAFAKATGKTALPAGHMIIRSENEPEPDEQVIPWVQGDLKMLSRHLEYHTDAIQNIYLESSETELQNIPADKIDLLKNAQSPEINWKPDGVDPLKWLHSLSF